MTQSTTQTAATSTPNGAGTKLAAAILANAGANGHAVALPGKPLLTHEQYTALVDTTMWAMATPAEQTALVADMQHAMSDGQALEEYTTGLAEYLESGQTTVQDYLAESGPAPESQAPTAEDQQPTPEPQSESDDADDADGSLAAVSEASKLSEEQEAAARKRCDVLLTAAGKAYRGGEKAYRQGLLEAGRLAQEYIQERLTLGDKRESAVDGVRGELNKYSSSLVDAPYVNRLVKQWACYTLLTDGDESLAKKAAGTVPYGFYRDAYSLLVQRVSKDGPDEAYILLPGYEELAKQLYRKAIANKLSLKAVQEAAQGLHKDYANVEAAKATKAAEASKQEAARLEEQRRLLAVKAAPLEDAAAKAKHQAAQEQDDQKRAEKAVEAKRLQDEADAARAQEKTARDEQILAAQKAATAEEERVKADKLAANALAKANKTTTKPTTTPAKDETPAKPATAPAECRGESILATLAKTVKAGASKDTAGMMARAVYTGSDDALAMVYDLAGALLDGTPDAADYGADDVLVAFLTACTGSGQASARAKRAAHAALSVLGEKAKPATEPATEPAAKPAPAPAAVA